MKKYLFLFFIICFTLSLCACSKDAPDPLGYQSYPFFVEGSLTCDEAIYDFSLSMEACDRSSITFSKPDSLRDFVFRVTPEGTTLSYEDMTIDFNKAEKTSLIRLIPSLFALKNEELVSSSEDMISSVPVLISCYNTSLGQLKVYLNKNTMTPLRFEGEDFAVDVLSFSPVPSAPTPHPTPTPTPAPTSDPTPTPIF